MFNQIDLDKEHFEWPKRSFQSETVALPDFSYFSPLARDAVQSSPPWKKKRTSQSRHTERYFSFTFWTHCSKMTLDNSCCCSGSLTGISGAWSDRSWSTHDTGRSGWNSELLIPLPVPHPVLICLLIYNRHRDVGAIPLETESCRLLMRYLEGSATPSGRTRE